MPVLVLLKVLNPWRSYRTMLHNLRVNGSEGFVLGTIQDDGCKSPNFRVFGTRLELCSCWRAFGSDI